jgi:hypothetical protein
VLARIYADKFINALKAYCEENIMLLGDSPAVNRAGLNCSMGPVNGFFPPLAVSSPSTARLQPKSG